MNDVCLYRAERVLVDCEGEERRRVVTGEESKLNTLGSSQKGRKQARTADVRLGVAGFTQLARPTASWHAAMAMR